MKDDRFCCLVEIVCHLWRKMLPEKSFETNFGKVVDNVNSVACGSSCQRFGRNSYLQRESFIDGFLPPEAASLVRLYLRHVLASWLADRPDAFGKKIEKPRIIQNLRTRWEL